MHQIDTRACKYELGWSLLAPECATGFHVHMSSTNCAGNDLRTKGYAWDVIFVASVTMALMVVGAALGSANTANAFALMTGGIHGNDGFCTSN